MLFWDSGTIVRHPYDNLVLDQIFHTYLGRSFGQSIFNGIDQQIAHYLLYFLLIPIHVDGIGIIHIKG